MNDLNQSSEVNQIVNKIYEEMRMESWDFSLFMNTKGEFIELIEDLNKES